MFFLSLIYLSFLKLISGVIKFHERIKQHSLILLNTMSGCCNWHKWRKRERGGENIGREVWNWINNFHQMWCFCWEQFERLIFLFMIMWYSQNVCYSTCSFQYCSLEGPLWYYILASHQLYSKNVLNRDNYILLFLF